LVSIDARTSLVVFAGTQNNPMPHAGAGSVRAELDQWVGRRSRADLPGRFRDSRTWPIAPFFKIEHDFRF
jgi:hypothetical protein